MSEQQKTRYWLYGYMTAYAVMYLSEIMVPRLVIWLGNILAEPVSVTTPNGSAASERDEKVAAESVELIQEASERE